MGRSGGRAQGSAVVLGVDIGTSAVKAVGFDAAGAVRGAASRGHPLHAPRAGEAVQDPEEVLAAVLDAIREAAGAVRDAGGEVAGLALSTAMHSLVALDGEHRPISPLVTWGDGRAAAQAERLRSAPGAHGLHARTGTPLHPMSPLAKLVWFREEAPGAFARARRWGGIKDLLLLRLTGEWIADHSSASGTGLMALDTLAWDRQALEIAGVGPEALPALVPVLHTGALAPAAGERLGLPQGLPVVAGGGDGPLANLGLGAVSPGVAACSIGTSGAIRVVVERPGIDPHGRVFCYALLPGRWVVGGAVNNGGVVLDWAAEALAPDLGPDAHEALLALAEEVAPGSEALLMLPHLLSERAPHWDAAARGAYVGLTRAHGRGHLVRAALEGVCLQLRLVLDSVRAAGHEVREVRATGGFARSPLWRQMLADVLEMEVGFAAGHEGSSFGAALLGMEALGLGDGLRAAESLVPIESVVAPAEPARAAYAALRPVYETLFAALAPANADLRRIREG